MFNTQNNPSYGLIV